MTATFGKLEHQTLTLQPGLNIIEAPNEWGKSTWCAFLVTMLYGLDTRAKTTKAALADKERFAPWSGAAMSGRIDLNWEGRDITIERSSKGRTPMGVFRAYETASGLEVPELTGSNCGQVLLGVERSVFTRSAFLRFSDLPVTQDDALRHRLNALVTTGDESGAAEALGQKLRDLKNHCRYNRSGLLPQAEAQRDELEKKLTELEGLTAQCNSLEQRSQELETQLLRLENHKAALEHAAAAEGHSRVREAEEAERQAMEQRQKLEQTCAQLPSAQEAEAAVAQLDELHRTMADLQAQEQLLPAMPQVPPTPACFAGIRPEDAAAQAEDDRLALEKLAEPSQSSVGLVSVLGGTLAAAGIGAAALIHPLVGVVLLLLAAAAFVGAVLLGKKHRADLEELQRKRENICRRYGSQEPETWAKLAAEYAAQWSAYHTQLAQQQSQRTELDSQRKVIHGKLQSLSGRTRSQWQEILSQWDALADAGRALQQQRQHLQTLRSMTKDTVAPTMPDDMTENQAETELRLGEARQERSRLQGQLGQCQGKMTALGNWETLQRELETVRRRIRALEQTYAALERAQEALTSARQELQRRFAPRITQRTQELFGLLTGQRYDRLTLGEDLSVQAGAQGEDVLRSQQWRSDGTVDQLYLALRLAVAGELIPAAPLVLDDALVRFDDERLAAALRILEQESQFRQVLLFTCQTRENAICKE